MKSMDKKIINNLRKSLKYVDDVLSERKVTKRKVFFIMIILAMPMGPAALIIYFTKKILEKK